MLKQLDSLENKLRPIDSITKPIPNRRPSPAKTMLIARADSPIKQADAIAARMKADPSLQVDLIEQGGGSAHDLKILGDMIQSLRVALINAGISGSRIHFSSHGESQPVADNNSPKIGILIKFKK